VPIKSPQKVGSPTQTYSMASMAGRALACAARARQPPGVMAGDGSDDSDDGGVSRASVKLERGGTPLQLRATTKVMYALPRMSIALFSMHINGTARKYYTDGTPHISPATLATLVTALKCADLIVGMVVGNCSDNWRSRWGRRKPFIAVGAPLWCISAVMLCLAPELSFSTGGFTVWFAGFYFMFYSVGYSCTVITYDALGMELTTDYDQRTSLFGWKGSMNMVGNIAAGVVGILFASLFPNDVGAQVSLNPYSPCQLGAALSRESDRRPQVVTPGLIFAAAVSCAFCLLLVYVPEASTSTSTSTCAALLHPASLCRLPANGSGSTSHWQGDPVKQHANGHVHAYCNGMHNRRPFTRCYGCHHTAAEDTKLCRQRTSSTPYTKRRQKRGAIRRWLGRAWYPWSIDSCATPCISDTCSSKRRPQWHSRCRILSCCTVRETCPRPPLLRSPINQSGQPWIYGRHTLGTGYRVVQTQ
jgi:hypothetical protein